MARRDPITPSALGLVGAAAGAAAASLSERDLAAALESSRARLRKVALRITRDHAAADDVVQSAIEKALRHRAQFRGDAKPSTWLHRIVVNEALMWRRSEARRRVRRGCEWQDAALTAVDPCPLPLDGLLARERHQRLLRGLLSLRSEDRDLIVCCALEGRSQVDWARAARMRPANAKTRAFRARRALRAALEAADS